MTALFESGSSHFHCAWWDGEKISGYQTMTYPLDGLLTERISCFLGNKIPELIAACSVSSKWREKLFTALNILCPGKLAVARAASDITVITSYKRPETYGIDRALAVYGAFDILGKSCVVIDIGTAVTVDAVDDEGRVIGGYIFPGPDMISDMIAERTDLPVIHPEYNIAGIGVDTDSALKYGIGKGILAAVDSLMVSACNLAGGTDNVVLTGGGAGTIHGLLSKKVLYKPHIVIEALGKVSEKLPLYA